MANVFLFLLSSRENSSWKTLLLPLSSCLPLLLFLLLWSKQRLEDIGFRVDGGCGRMREKNSNFFFLTSNLYDLLVNMESVEIVFEKCKIRSLYYVNVKNNIYIVLRKHNNITFKNYCLSLWMFHVRKTGWPDDYCCYLYF